MFFKKKKVNKYSNFGKIISQAIAITSIFLIFILGISIVKIVENINFNFLEFAVGKNPIISNNSGKTDKEKINILILGRGGGTHDAPNLTDTIILGSINLEKNTISMLSIPRDLYVEYPGMNRSGKINQIYRSYLKKGENIAISKLKEKISEITGEEINYYVNVDFKGFKEIIDILGGVEVTVPRNFVDNKFPDGKHGYTSFILRKGTWILDGEVALKYARSRHSTSDFDRSIRQQQILTSLKEKLKELGYFKDSNKIRKLFLSLEKNIKTDISIKSLLKIGLFFKKNDVKILSFNINDSCFYGSNSCSKGGFLYVPLKEYFHNLSVLLPEGADKNNISNYYTILKYSDNIFNKPEIFKENYKINIFNSTKTKFLARGLADEIKKYGLNIPEKDSIGNIRDKDFEKSILYYNNIKKDSATINVIKTLIDIEIKKVEKPIFSEYEDTKIEIILGKDYKEITKK